MKPTKGNIIIKPFKHDPELERLTLKMHHYFKRITSRGLVVAVSESKSEFDCCSVGDVVVYDRYSGIDIEYNDSTHEVINQSEVVCLIVDGEYKIPYNYVLVEKLEGTAESNTNFIIDKSFQKERFASTYGKVIAAPDNLMFFGKEISQRELYADSTIAKMTNMTIKWDNPDGVLVKKDDIVHFHYLSIENAEVLGLIIEDESTSKKYYLIRYDLCYAFERGEDIVFINGYCGVDIENIPTTVETETSVNIFNLNEKGDKRWGLGTLVFISTPNKSYITYDFDEENAEAKVGDVVNFQHTKRMKIGNDILIKNEKLKNIHLIQKKDINFII
jgi:co-chaperonin GroES (HSP10)